MIDFKALCQQVDMLDLASTYTAMQRRGSEHWGCCPLPGHHEKTPSFAVHPDKGYWYCQGCHRGGAAIHLVMAMEGLDRMDAALELAQRYNIDLELPPDKTRQISEKQRLLQINTLALEFYRKQLRSPAGQVARDYLAGRGILPETVERFELGYAPKSWDALTDYLLGEGYRSGDLIKLSLIKARESGGGYYDFLRHRVIFPMRDVTGALIGFSGRAVSAEDNPKYLNVAEGPLYSKAKFCYGIWQAKDSLLKQGAVLVEGQLDMVALHQVGQTNAVSLCGSAFTDGQAALLGRYTDQFTFAGDGDQVGLKLNWEGSSLLLTLGYIPKVIALPEGADPGAIALGQDGARAWEAWAQTHQPAVCWWLRSRIAGEPNADAAAQRGWIKSLAPLYAALPDELSQRDFAEHVGQGLKLDIDVAVKLLDRHAGEVRAAAKTQQGKDERLKLERVILRRMLDDEQIRFCYQNMASPEWFEDEGLRELARVLIAGEDSREDLLQHGELGGVVAMLLAQPDDSDCEGEALLRMHRNQFVQRQAAELLLKAKAEPEPERSAEYMVQAAKLKAQIGGAA